MIMTNDTPSIQVRKKNGKLVPFDEEKLQDALVRSGADRHEIDRVVSKVKASLYEGITTGKIYQIAYSILKKTSHRTAGRYRLKKAIFELGPSGYPFEHFITRLFEHEGYAVKTAQRIMGKCVSHEVDVVAMKGRRLRVAECKFHQSESTRSDVKISLYVHARFLDIREKWLSETAGSDADFEPMLITNTRFTEDAMQYGRCAGLNLVSWDYPARDSLKDRIDRAGLHPLTALKGLTIKEKRALLDKGIVLCREIVNDPKVLSVFSFTQRKVNRVVEEAEALVGDSMRQTVESQSATRNP